MKTLLAKTLGLTLLALGGIGIFSPAVALSEEVTTLMNQDDSLTIVSPLNHLSDGDGSVDGSIERRGDFDRRNDRDPGIGRDHGRFDHDRDFDRNRRPPPRRDFGCGNDPVTLYCKINGHHDYITAYTDCGYVRENGFCERVYTPGYYQVAMRVAFRCENGNWVWLLGNNGQCKLSY